MTRINTPKFEREQELADAMSGRGRRSQPQSKMNNLMRGQKSMHNERRAVRVDAKLKKMGYGEPPSEDAPDVVKAREVAEAARVAADEAARSLARRNG